MNRTVDPCVDFYAFTCGAGKPGQGMSFDISDNTITDTMVNQLRQPEKYFDNDVSRLNTMGPSIGYLSLFPSDR